MTDMPLPSAEQEQRAKWDLLLLDIEQRSEQIRHMKGYNPLETETRLEQLRQMKSYEGKRLVIQGLVAGGTLLAAGGVVGGLIVRLLGGHG